MQADGTLLTALGGTEVSALSEAALPAGPHRAWSSRTRSPARVGGAVWMNARCFEREVSDVLEFVDYLDADLVPAAASQWSRRSGDTRCRRSSGCAA